MEMGANKTALQDKAPPIPRLVESLLHEEWDALEHPEASAMLSWMQKQRAFHEACTNTVLSPPSRDVGDAGVLAS